VLVELDLCLEPAALVLVCSVAEAGVGLPASSCLRLSRSSSEILSLIALASFSFLSTTLPHHY